MPTQFASDLKFIVRDRGYSRGQEGYEQILGAALGLLINQGYRALSFRRIAEASGIKAGHISYYFPSKEALVRDLLDAVIGRYEDEFSDIVHEAEVPAETRLERMIIFILDDILTKKTTHLFMELWALSNHDNFVLERVQDLYTRAREPLIEIIAEINPALTGEERETLALFISASMEGMTVFAGYSKPFSDRMPMLEQLAIKSFIALVRNTLTGEMKAHTKSQ